MSGNLGETTTHESPKVVGIVGGLYAASVTGTLTLDGSHGDRLVLTPTAARTVLLQPEATRKGVTVQIANAGAYTLTVKEDSNTTTIAAVEAGCVAWFNCDGTTWTLVHKVAGPVALTVISYAAPQVIDMAGAAHALVNGTAGAAQTQVTGNVFAVDANGTGGGSSGQTLTLPAVVDGRELIIFNAGGEAITLSGSAPAVVIPANASARLMGSSLGGAYLVQNADALGARSIVSGTLTIVAGQAAGTVSVGAAYNAKPVVCQPSRYDATWLHPLSAIVAAGTLTITGAAATTADVDVYYVIDGR